VLSRAILVTLRERVPPPAHGTSLVTLDAPVETAPGVPVFDASWDLNGAVQLLWNDQSLTAYPAAPGMSITCAATHLSVNVGASRPSWQAGYPADLLNVSAGTALFVSSQPTCVDTATKLGVLKG
jgi:hypothetical protein